MQQTPAPPHPNTGRILDHWLGGTHHFPADRAAASAFDAIYGEFPRVFRVLRDFIGRASRFVESQGVDQFLVLGAGVPTQGNVHEAVPSASVLYTDIDPLNVELGARILAGSPRTGYGYCDARDLSTLDRGLLTRVLGPPRRLGIVVVGCAVFLADDELRRLFAELHEWAPAGSHLIFDFDSTQLEAFPAALAMLGDSFYMRKPQRFEALLGPWRLSVDGIRPVGDWRNDASPTIPTFMYGGVAHKSA